MTAGSDPLPTRIGPYDILAVLGRGTMGIVYRARDRRSGALVALKTCPGVDQTALGGLHREIYALRKLTHPGVVRILSQGNHDGLPWFAMELLEGPTLRTWLDARPARLAETLAILVRVCDPLAHIHTHGFVHGDLKPENIHLRADGTPVLVDFGLHVRSGGTSGREALEVGGSMFGTAAYMAPEQIRGELVDQRADLYALGCILYEAITGAPPFTGASPGEVLYRHLDTPPAPPADVPAWLERLVLQLLAKSRRDRLGYADTVAATIAAQLNVPRLHRLDDAGRSYLYRSDFVGREPALAELTARIEKATTGRGALVFVSGESGIGKTRLAMEAGTAAVRRDMAVLLGECTPLDGGGRVALQPFRPFLTWLADRCQQSDPDVVDRLVGPRGPVLALYEPRLATLPGQADQPPLPDVSPESALERVQRAVIETLVAAAADGPLVLVLDDLQWADELSVAVLAALQTRGLADVPLVLIGTYRVEETPAALAALVERPGADVVRLDPLRQSHVARMVGDMLAMPEPPGRFVRTLYEHADGNPFHVSEYVQVAVERRYLRRDEHGAWRLEPAESWALPMPRSLHELVGLRLDALGETARGIARIASVVGPSFEEPLLMLAGRLSEGPSMEAVHELLHRRILRRDDRGLLAFGHEQIRSVTYDRIAAATRPLLHRQVAEALEEYCTDDARRRHHAAALAHQWTQAAEPPDAERSVVARATEAIGRAAEQAERAQASLEAIRLFETALRLQGRTGATGAAARADRARWERLLGEAYFRVGSLLEARTHLAASLTLSGPRPATGTTRLVGRLVREGCRHALHATIGRRTRGDAGRTLGAARAYDLLGFVHLFTMDRLSSLVSTLQAVTLAERLPPSPVLANSSAMFAAIAGTTLSRGVGRHYFALAVDTARRLGDDYCLGRVTHMHGFYLIGQGVWAEAERACEESAAAFGRVGDGRWHDIAALTLANARHIHRRAGALPLYLDALGTASERGDAQAEAWGHLGCANAHLAAGDERRTLALIDGNGTPLATCFAQICDFTSQADTYGVEATALFRLGRHADAEQSVRRALEVVQRIPVFRYDPLPGYVLPADTALRLWETAQSTAPERARAAEMLAAETLVQLRAFARFIRIAQPHAGVLTGLAHWLGGRPTRAFAAWRAAGELARHLDMPYEEALTHFEIGRHLDAGRDRETHLRRAESAFAALGTGWELRATRDALGAGVEGVAAA